MNPPAQHDTRSHQTRPRRGLVALALGLALASTATAGIVHADNTSGEAPSSATPTAESPTASPSPTTTTVATPTSTSSTTTTTVPAAKPPKPAAATTSTTVAAPVATTTSTPAPPAPPAPAAQRVIAYPSQIANILATIRYMESRGNYHLPKNKGGASGAYQFITSTWDDFGGYSEAYLAPPEVQDERAAADVTRFLEQWDNDVSMVPVMWYYPRASRDLTLMDVVPVPSAGNVLTVREYQQRWLGVWAFLAGQPIPQPLTLAESLSRMGLPPELPALEQVDQSLPAEERTAAVAFPVLGPTRLAAPDCGDAQDATQNAGGTASAAEIQAAGLCADQAPGIVFGVKLQPVLSVTDGVVTDVVDVTGETISVTVTDLAGRSYRLAGFNDDNPGTDDGAAAGHLRLTPLARVGTTVRAGQVLGFMGDTDPLPLGIRSDVPTDATVDIPIDAVAPHIRLTIRDIDGTPVDAYGPVIDALFRQVCSVATGPWSSPPNGADHEPVVIETTDDNRDIDSQWVITDTGQVTAAGWAAMIYPSESCTWVPEEARGPGAAGTTDVPVAWLTPIDLSTAIWVGLAVGERGDDLPTIPIRRP